MGEIVNLRRVKKARMRSEAAAEAAANRAAHGRPAAERSHTEQERARLARLLDNAALEPDAAPGEEPGGR